MGSLGLFPDNQRIHAASGDDPGIRRRFYPASRPSGLAAARTYAELQQSGGAVSKSVMGLERLGSRPGARLSRLLVIHLVRLAAAVRHLFSRTIHRGPQASLDQMVTHRAAAL